MFRAGQSVKSEPILSILVYELAFKFCMKADYPDCVEWALMHANTTAGAKVLANYWSAIFSHSDSFYTSSYFGAVSKALLGTYFRLAPILVQYSDSHW